MGEKLIIFKPEYSTYIAVPLAIAGQLSSCEMVKIEGYGEDEKITYVLGRADIVVVDRDEIRKAEGKS